MNHKSLNELLCAATVNARFRETLLHNPARAVAAGYFDHSFALTQEERDLVVNIRAQDLADFASQVYTFITGNGAAASRYADNGPNGNGHNGNGYNGNGHNGNGRKKEVWTSEDATVDLYRTPAFAHA